MFGGWYNSSLRRYIVLMGDLFSRIEIVRPREDGVKYIKVPITYASKEHFIQKLDAINSINSQENIAKVETILPRMNLHLVDIQYNAPYKTALQNRSAAVNVTKNNVTALVSQNSPTPIKMIFELGVHTRYQDDMLQIVEQIIPYFQPHFNTTIKELYGNEIVVNRDIRITWQSLSMDEEIDGPGNSRRRLEWSFIFEVNGWIYPPVREIEGEIRTIYLDFFASDRTLDAKGNFESIDHEVEPKGVDEVTWNKDKKIKKGLSANTPIPVDPEPPGVRNGE